MLKNFLNCQETIKFSYHTVESYKLESNCSSEWYIFLNIVISDLFANISSENSYKVVL